MMHSCGSYCVHVPYVAKLICIWRDSDINLVEYEIIETRRGSDFRFTTKEQVCPDLLICLAHRP